MRWVGGGLPFGDGDEGETTGGPGGKLTQLHGVIGSEKRAYFEDPDVVARLEELGYRVSVTTAGSRQIATTTDIAEQDFVFPSSAPATQKVRDQGSGYSADFPFFTPMAVASWKPIADLLVAEGVVREENGAYTLDVNKYMDLARSGKRWRDLGEAYPSPRNVQIRSTDIRTSNSAAMYLSLLTWEVAERDPERRDDVGFPAEATPVVLDRSLRETSKRLGGARPPRQVMAQARALEDTVRLVLSEWEHLEPTPEHRQTIWNVVKVYYPEVVDTYLDAPQYRDASAVWVVVDSLTTLTRAAGRVRQGILDDNLRAMDSQAQFLREELGELPGLDDSYRGGDGYDPKP